MVGSQRRSLDIALVLLGVMVVELALNRLAVPALRPATAAPEPWHRSLDQVALFVFHFATALSFGVLARRLGDTLRRPGHGPRPLRAAVAAFGAGLAVLALWSALTSPSLDAQFALQTAFTLTVTMAVLTRMTRPGSFALKAGLLVLTAPLVLHYYAPFVLRVIDHTDLSVYPNIPRYSLPTTMRRLGQHAVVIGALVSPYLLAPRPLVRSLLRPAPLAIASFVGLIAGIILREQYEVGAELAMMGLGFDIGQAGAPRSLLALYLLALATVTWTLASCLIADAPSRRRIGVGLALVVVGGYAFEWPLQYLVAAVGVLEIVDASLEVDGEEAAARRERADRATFHSPPIPGPAWQRYVGDLVRALRARGDESSAAVSFARDGGVSVTHVVAPRGEVTCEIRITRAGDAIHTVDVLCGAAPPEGRAPDWTLHARPERMLAIGAHPEPPTTGAPAIRTRDAAFDRRFRVRDRGGLTGRLLDEGLRARATALVDGWIAFWPGACLLYRVLPGRGAPLDHPIPISELAFRGSDAPTATDRLLGLLDLLAEMARRGGLEGVAPPPAEEPPAEEPGAEPPGEPPPGEPPPGEPP